MRFVAGPTMTEAFRLNTTPATGAVVKRDAIDLNIVIEFMIRFFGLSNEKEKKNYSIFFLRNFNVH